MSTTALTAIGSLLLTVLIATWVTVRYGSWRLLAVGSAAVVVCAAIGIWFYTKRPVPESLPCALSTSIGDIGSICGFRNPEDLEHVPSLGLVLISEEGFGGRLLSLNLYDLRVEPRVLWPPAAAELALMEERGGDLGDDDCPFPADPSALWPHGLSTLASKEPGEPVRVAFVSHRLVDGVLTDAVQLFDLAVDEVTPLRWRGCIDYPVDVMGNDLAFLRDGSWVATNFAPRGTPDQLQRYARRGGLGIETGDVMRWSRSQGWSHISDTEGALPNGIALAPDERMLYFADAGNSRVTFVPLDAKGGEIMRVNVGGAPNNLTVNESGKVLATVATLAGDLPILCAIGGRQCRSGWAVVEIDPATGTVQEIVAEEGRKIASATTALEIEGTLFIGSMADTRIGVYRRR